MNYKCHFSTGMFLGTVPLNIMVRVCASNTAISDTVHSQKSKFCEFTENQIFAVFNFANQPQYGMPYTSSDSMNFYFASRAMM